MLNTQLPESLSSDDTYLELHSMFLTIQGEGPFSGRRALFIRLAGCNLQCPGCDTDYTSNRERITPKDLVARVVKKVYVPTLIVITGGEPFRQHLTPQLVWELAGIGFVVQVETNGTVFPSIMRNVMMDWSCVHVVCSPKTPNIARGLADASRHPELGPRISFKYVIDSACIAGDGLPHRALENPVPKSIYRPLRSYMDKPHRIYIQPFDVPDDPEHTRNNHACTVESGLTHGYTVQLQIHKLLELE